MAFDQRHTDFCLASGPPQFDSHELAQKFDGSVKDRKLRVLVIDDERLIADTTAEILNGNGFEAVPLYNGNRAVEHIRQTCPDVVITDVMMPGINGIELAKEIKGECPQTRVVLISGQAATTDLLASARRQGFAFEILAKPLKPETLLHKLRESD
ncbi:MAG: hypothetical protein QOD84_1787 [Acidobacteriaceae bacterium]|jgi:CheY-like chemotaxis protein